MVKPLVCNTLGMKVAEHSSHQFLAALIHVIIKVVSRMISLQFDHLASVLNPTEIEDLKAHASKAQELEMTTMKTRTAQKDRFDRLLKKYIPPKHDNRWVVNLSSKELSPNEEVVLKKGINFAVTPADPS